MSSEGLSLRGEGAPLRNVWRKAVLGGKARLFPEGGREGGKPC